MTSEIIDILVLDDEESIRWVIGKTLKRPAYRLHFSASAEEAARVMDSRKVDLALVDINLPGQDGLSFITSQLELRPGVLMAVITGQGTMNHAVQAMKAGAFDYLTKPFDIEELEEMVERAARTIRQTRSSEGGPAPQVEPRVGEQDTIIGVSRALREVYKAIGRVADSDLTVLILGESGTGKELIARAIHTNSGRAPEPFVAVNCAAIPRELLEAELFGHEKGAFTGAVEKKSGRLESAGLGTVFLDEIGDMSLELQAKLLRVLQEREYQPVGGVETRRMKARVLAATNQSLEEAVAQGRFRADLFYRVNAFTINVPPLRERREDILVLARHFLALTGKKLELPLPVLTEAAGR
ncbi:MAG: sigma-54 dependent transcriptional regulator, partial [Deltaproteobacteria bacterium]|nr:sigma-54 dependent transcriptional regulator [Deltaproteobacteria bacterium]